MDHEFEDLVIGAVIGAMLALLLFVFAARHLIDIGRIDVASGEYRCSLMPNNEWWCRRVEGEVSDE